MIDIHCHILPGVDDGAKDLEETEQMLRMAYGEGIRTILATPHFSEGMTDEVRERRKEAYARTARLARTIARDLTVLPGGELFYSERAVEELRAGKIWTLNRTAYVLVEFPIFANFAYIRQAVQRLQCAGYEPVIAHIERYAALDGDDKLQTLKDMGALLQMNASTLTAKAGWRERRHLVHILRKKYVDLIGTDAHGSTHRRPLMQVCAAYIEKKTDRQYRMDICENNAKKLIGREHTDA